MAYRDLSTNELIDAYVELSQLVTDLKASGVYDCARMSRLDDIREELSSRGNWIDEVNRRRAAK